MTEPAGVARGPGLPALSREVRTVAAALIVLLGLASIVAHAFEYAGPERFSKDFALDYSSGKALLDGGDPYAPIDRLVARYLAPPPEVLRENVLPGANWHTPFKLIVTLPLTALPYRAAGVVWLMLCAAAMVAAGILLGRELGWSRAASWTCGFAILAVPVAQVDLSAGNLNGPMLLLVVAAWRAMRRRREGALGAALGVLAALKFFPALLAGPLLATRRFRAVGTAAAVAVALTLAGFAMLGSDHARSFAEAGRGSEGFDHWDAAPANISWWGAASRWLVPNGWVDGLDAPGVGVALAIAGVLVWTALLLRPREGLSGEPLLAAVPLMLLAWPISWVHYLVLAVPWVFVAGARVARRGGPVLLAAFGVVALFLLVGFPPGLPPPERASAVHVALGYQAPTYALIAAVVLERGSGLRRVAQPSRSRRSSPTAP